MTEQDVICPFLGKQCTMNLCTFWLSTEDGKHGTCSFKEAHFLQIQSANLVASMMQEMEEKSRCRNNQYI